MFPLSLWTLLLLPGRLNEYGARQLRIAAQNFSSIRPWTDGFHANGRYGRKGGGGERSRQLSAEISRTEIATYISRRIVFMYIYVCLRPAASLSSFRAVIAQLHIRSSNPPPLPFSSRGKRKKKRFVFRFSDGRRWTKSWHFVQGSLDDHESFDALTSNFAPAELFLPCAVKTKQLTLL